MLKIRDWDKRFENSRSRQIAKAQWVPIPNSFDDDVYLELAEHENGPALVGCYYGIIRLASKCHPRGTLLKSTGKPHDIESIARALHFPPSVVQSAVQILSDIGEVEGNPSEAYYSQRVTPPDTEVAPECQSSGTRVAPKCQAKYTEGNGKNGKEEKRKKSPSPKAQEPKPFTQPDRPTPKQVLTYWDAAWQKRHTEPYPRTAGGREAKQASQVIKAVETTGGPWERIPRAIDACMRSSFGFDKSFGVFAGQFQNHDIAAKNGGTGKDFDPIAYAAAVARGEA